MPDAQRLTDFLFAELEGNPQRRTTKHALNGFVDVRAQCASRKMLVAATRPTASPMVFFFGKEQLKKREGRVVVL
ncbi:MAG: hypothetical protein IPL86_17505 [Flavobacteriales bacterium]|nr:hypothetical protein [Flavobacteriales bacterium]